MAVFDTAIAYESGQANIKGTFLNVLKGFFAASLITVVPQRLYSFCTSLQGTFAADLLASFVGSTSDTVAGTALSVVVAEGNWISWCTFEGIDYPQEVMDKINEIQNPTEENTEENENGE